MIWNDVGYKLVCDPHSHNNTVPFHRPVGNALTGRPTEHTYTHLFNSSLFNRKEGSYAHPPITSTKQPSSALLSKLPRRALLRSGDAEVLFVASTGRGKKQGLLNSSAHSGAAIHGTDCLSINQSHVADIQRVTSRIIPTAPS